MRPNPAINNSPNRRNAYVVPPSKFGRRVATICILGANFEHLLFVKFVAWMRFALVFGRGSSTFGGHVLHIIGCVAKKQMIGIAARRAVTVMQAMKSVWDRTKVKFPTDTMGSAWLAVYSQRTIATTVVVSESLPKPTFVESAGCEVFPKPVSKMRPVSAMRCAALVVSVNKSEGLPFNPTVAFACHAGNLRLFAATTVAITIGNFAGGVMRGMICHVNSLLSTLTTPGTPQTSPGNFIGCYSFNYTTGEAN